MHLFGSNGNRSPQGAAFSLTEVVMSVALAGICIGSAVYGYVLYAKRAEWSAYSLAAQSMAMQRVEQMRSCKWDTMAVPAVDELIPANFAAVTTNALDVPISGTNVICATNFSSITLISSNPPVKMLKVDCVWRYLGGRLYTNSVTAYRSPDG